MNRISYERRQYPRVKITGLVKIINEKNKSIFASLHDISEGGLQIFTSDAIEPEDPCTFILHLPGDHLVSGIGQVSYSNDTDYKGKQGHILGIKFLHIDSLYLQKVQHYVAVSLIENIVDNQIS